jgi:ubiquinone/menaquinone biosynthesis C-methylase UbiE/DNA-directed RNA polymerase subunit RPC12/RpoP
MADYPCPVCGAESVADSVELAGYRLYRCPECHLRFAPEAFGAGVDYDGVYQSEEYRRDQVQELRSLDGNQLGEHPTYRAFFQQVRHSPGAKLLDLGCGVGRFGHGAHARGWDVAGVDVSERAIEIGREAAPFPLRVGTAAELVDEGQRFEVVTAFEVLEHLSSPLEFIGEAKRLLCSGGQAFFTVPNWESHTVQTTNRPDWLPPIHLLFFTQKALRRAGERGGLSRVSVGFIQSDPLPSGIAGRMRWLARRVLRRPREPLGLWLHGWAPDGNG